MKCSANRSGPAAINRLDAERSSLAKAISMEAAELRTSPFRPSSRRNLLSPLGALGSRKTRTPHSATERRQSQESARQPVSAQSEGNFTASSRNEEEIFLFRCCQLMSVPPRQGSGGVIKCPQNVAQDGKVLQEPEPSESVRKKHQRVESPPRHPGKLRFTTRTSSSLGIISVDFRPREGSTEVATGWIECVALLRRSEADVSGAIHATRQCLPFPLLGLDTDNGGEFINHELLRYCEKEKITFTRSRPYRINDQAHVEEKNGSVIRRPVGYDCYEGLEPWRSLTALHGAAVDEAADQGTH